MFSVKTVFGIATYFELPLKGGFGPSHDFFPLQLFQTPYPLPKLLSEITALKMLFPFFSLPAY